MKEPTILKTLEHGIFNDVTSNREVDPLHVKHLKEAIEDVNLLHLNPIIVNSAHEVIDGQHRLEAATELKTAIYYVVDDKVNKKHIAKLNSNQKNWKPIDYVNYYAVEKVPEYLVLSDFICRHPLIPVSTLVQLLSPYEKRESKAFREGRLNVDNQQQANVILALVEKIRNLGIEIAFDRNLILAINDAFKIDGFNPDLLISKIEADRLALFKCAKKQQYLQLLEGIYNKHQHSKLRFY